ncbi:MAG TPA: hypothetical protein RWN64_08305, partial [Ruminococcus sp.]
PRTPPEDLPLDSAKGLSTLWKPGFIKTLFHTLQGLSALDLTKGLSTLWKPGFDYHHKNYKATSSVSA